MKKLVQYLLTNLAVKIVQKYQPKIVGVTGTFGKTSTRHAVVKVLSQEFSVREPLKNLNTPLGFALTIIDGSYPQGADVFGWAKVFWHALFLLAPGKRLYPQILVLEYGIDQPGDMDELLRLVRPDTAVLTGLGLTHVEFFKDQEQLFQEKYKLLSGVKEGGVRFANYDNEYLRKHIDTAATKVQWYGTGGQGNVQTLNLVREDLVSDRPASVVSFDLNGQIYEVKVFALGSAHLASLSSAVAVAVRYGLSGEEIVRGLSSYKPVPGRMNVIEGINHSVILDDTYNASPDSMAAAVELLSRWPADRKLVILGDMLELGEASYAEHYALGQKVAHLKPYGLILVGEYAEAVQNGAVESGLDKGVIEIYSTTEDVVKVVRPKVRDRSVVLVKSSQGNLRFEKITKELMADPAKAKDLLVRQYGAWLHK